MPLDYLEESSDEGVSKYTVIYSTACSLFNQEHPGFPVKFMLPEMKIQTAQQILGMLNREKFLQHCSIPEFSWRETNIEDVHEVIDTAAGTKYLH